MTPQVLKIRKKRSDPVIEITIGQAQQGSYKIFLWDRTGKRPKLVASGLNWDDVPDTHKIGRKADLDGTYLTWEILVTAPAGGDGQRYAVAVVARQGDSVCEGGLYQESGELSGTKAVFGARRISVA